MTSIVRYVEDFLAARDVSHAYAEMLRARCRAFEKHHGREVGIDELSPRMVNEWLAYLQGLKLSPSTVDGYRRNIMVVWRAAFEEELNDNQPVRVRKIKQPRRVVEAYTQAEIRALLSAASKLKGRHRNGNRRADFWQALIHAAYSTALRRSDLLLVFRRDIASDGIASIVQSKTGYMLRVRFSQQALEFANRLKDNNGLLLPWPYRKDALPPRFKVLARLAGVNRGSLKWLRRSAGSYAEREEKGAGARLLGHRDSKIFAVHYDDQTISAAVPVQPPPL